MLQVYQKDHTRSQSPSGRSLSGEPSLFKVRVANGCDFCVYSRGKKHRRIVDYLGKAPLDYSRSGDLYGNTVIKREEIVLGHC